MHSVKKVRGAVVGAWVAAALLFAGCGGDDSSDSGGSVTTLSTNVVVSGGRTNVVVTATPAAQGGEAGQVATNNAAGSAGSLQTMQIPIVALPSPQTAIHLLPAPQLVSPAKGSVYIISQLRPQPVRVDFQWTPVAGAVEYHFIINGAAHLVDDGTTVFHGALDTAGRWWWKVAAADANGIEGEKSQAFYVDVKKALLVQ